MWQAKKLFSLILLTVLLLGVLVITILILWSFTPVNWQKKCEYQVIVCASQEVTKVSLKLINHQSLANLTTDELLKDVNLKQKFVITKGETVNTISEKLYQQKLIRFPLLFSFLLKYLGLEVKIQAGSFQLSDELDAISIVYLLIRGSDDLWITILEGWRREEIADYLSKQVELTEFSVSEFLTATRFLEGKLYPDTYLVPKDISTTALINLLVRTFEQKTAYLWQDLDKATQLDNFDQKSTNSVNWTEKEVLILASLVQREARNLEQMKLVASILKHRLSIGMPLQVDASLQYLKAESGGGRWWLTPLAGDKNIDSPFNTYLYSGLPPAPICNPGYQAILASLNPEPTTMLFYLHDKDGRMHIAETLSQHNLNINQYLRK